jgi:uncharacterized membrane protein YdbT with pleckstrin-like domain
MSRDTTPAAPEAAVLTFSPSLWSRAGALALCVLLCVLIVPIFIAIWIIVETRLNQYELTSERLKITTGVFNRKTDNLELYRITDLTMSQSFLQRLVGIGNIQMVTTDRTTPTLDIRGIHDHTVIADKIRELTEKLRQKRGQREFDVV